MSQRRFVPARLSAAMVVGLWLSAAAPAFAQDILYGSTRGSSGGEVGTIDQSTAALTILGDATETGPLPAIAMNSQGELFGSKNSGTGGSSSVGELIRIDPATGTLIETIGTVTDTADEQPLRITDLDFQPGTGLLYGYASKGPKEGSIFTISTATARATLVGSTGLTQGGLGFGPDGKLYVATVDKVFARVDPATAQVIGTPLSLVRGCEGLAVRPSDGVIFATQDDGNILYTINPTTGDATTIGSADVSDLTFAAGALVPAVEGFLRPDRVTLSLNARKPARSRLSVRARIDDCCTPADFSQPLTLDLNGTVWELPGLTASRRGTTFRLKNGELTLTVRPRLRGTSRGLVDLRLVRDLESVIAPDGPLTVTLTSGALNVSGTATLSGKRFIAGRYGTIDDPTLVPLSLRGRLGDPDGTSLSLTLALPGTTATPSDVVVTVGDFSQTIAAEDFAGSDERPRFSSRGPGVRSLRIDHKRGEVRVSLSRATIGFTSGDLTLRLRIGQTIAAVTITPRVSGKSISY